jgi:hypothetical protein
MSAFRFGATVIYSMGWEIAASIRKLPACHTFLLVGAAADLLSSEQFRDGRLDSCSLCVGGGFVPNTLRAGLRQSVTTDLQIAYSTNETRDITTDDGDGPGTVLPDVSVRIVDDSGREMQPGQSGRVLVRTPRRQAAVYGTIRRQKPISRTVGSLRATSVACRRWISSPGWEGPMT